MTGVRSTKRSPEYQRAAVAYAAALRETSRRRGLTRNDVARLAGVTPTMVGFYMRAAYLPRPDVAAVIAEALEEPRLAELARSGRRIRCAMCGRPTWRGTTRRRYCSTSCWDKSRQSVPSGAFAQQAAIDAYCAGCEPEGICRTPECPLQPFSPLPLIELHRMGAA